jgi:plastocyanin domain-containing protein
MKLVQPIITAGIILGIIGGAYFLMTPGSQPTPSTQSQTASSASNLVDGKQLLQMTVKAVSYSPNSFTVKAGVPVRWEITSSGQPGCDSGEIIAKDLLDGPVMLNPDQGQVTVKEFTPQNPGTYRFSCPMGMVRGTVNVVN